jgi:hypothetical protein
MFSHNNYTQIFWINFFFLPYIFENETHHNLNVFFLGVHSYLGYQKGLFNHQRNTSCNFNKVKLNLILSMGFHNCIILDYSIWYIPFLNIFHNLKQTFMFWIVLQKLFFQCLKMVASCTEWIYFFSKFYLFFYF